MPYSPEQKTLTATPEGAIFLPEGPLTERDKQHLMFAIYTLRFAGGPRRDISYAEQVRAARELVSRPTVERGIAEVALADRENMQ